MKKNKEEYVPITCAVCTECYRRADSARCWHGGPYVGYVKVKSTYDV